MSYDLNEVRKMMMQGYTFDTMPLEDAIYVKGKVALVVGGTSGLGYLVAKRLLEGGANVVVSSYSDAEAELALPLLSQIGYGEDRVKFFKSDVTKETDMEAVVKFTVGSFGSLDIAVNSAGIWQYAHIYDMPEEVFTRVIDVNLNGNFRFTKYVSKYMVENGVKGTIVLISSDCYTMPYPVFGGYPNYAASKGGIVALATELARELKRFGINVNSVAPGPMATPGGMVNGIWKDLPEEKFAELAAEFANPKLDQPLNTDDVARVVYMMCTPLAAHITGETILANAGLAHGCKVYQPAIEEYPPKDE